MGHITYYNTLYVKHTVWPCLSERKLCWSPHSSNSGDLQNFDNSRDVFSQGLWIHTDLSYEHPCAWSQDQLFKLYTLYSSTYPHKSLSKERWICLETFLKIPSCCLNVVRDFKTGILRVIRQDNKCLCLWYIPYAHKQSKRVKERDGSKHIKHAWRPSHFLPL